MNVEQQKVLITWARLQLEIAVSRNPAAALDVTPATVTRSTGYRKLRAWFVHLSPRARDGAVRWMRSHIKGVRDVMAAAKASGEAMSLADVTIEVFDRETGARIGDAPEFETATMCHGSGGGIPDVEIDGNNRKYVKCTHCLMRWDAHAIGFKLPDHEPLI